MVAQLIVIVIVGLISAFLGALLALRFQQSHWKNIHAQQDGWEHAQQSHHRNWEEKQEKLIAAAEAKFIAQVQQLHHEWQQWEVKDSERIAEHTRQQERSNEQARIERELARLPRIEETSMVLDSKQATGSQSSPHWRPAALQGANLSELDLSHRYLGRADLRNAQLSHTNFFMADLSGAYLTNTDLSNADLSGANLSNTDLRGATLTGANLLVADLNNAILTGANLSGARNLTPQQVSTSFYDSTTSLEPDIASTLLRTSSMHNVPEGMPSTLPGNEDPRSDSNELAENDDPVTDNIFEETMPALAIIKPELQHLIPQESSLPVSIPQYQGDELVQHESAQPEISLPTIDNSENSNEIPRQEMDHRETDGEEIRVPSLHTDSAPSDDSATSAQQIHMLSDNQQNQKPDKSVAPLRKNKRHGRKRAKVG